MFRKWLSENDLNNFDFSTPLFLKASDRAYWGASAHRLPMRHRAFENIPNVDDPYLDLHSAQTACSIAVIYNLLYDEIYAYCPEILTRIENELEKRIKNQYLRRMDHTWMGYYYGVNNWNPWILSHFVTVFLMTENRQNYIYYLRTIKRTAKAVLFALIIRFVGQ